MATNARARAREVRVRFDDRIYVYLYEDGLHVDTLHLDWPARWDDRWPSAATVRRYIRKQVDLGSAKITTLDA